MFGTLKPLTPRGAGSAFLPLFLVRAAVFCLPAFFLAGLPPAAFPAEESGKKSFWEEHGKVEDESTAPDFSPGGSKIALPDKPVPLTIDNLRIPVEHGSLKETYSAREPIIIHIQDAHANYTAQRHLSGILEYLVRAHALSLILVEGGSRNDSLSYMRTYAPLEKRKQVADEFLQAGKISGENYLDLTTDYDFTVYGIERPELYDANMEAFFNVEKVQSDAVAAIAGFHDAVAELKSLLYPNPVKVMEVKEEEVEAGRIPLAQHYEELHAEAEQVKVMLKPADYPNLDRFLQASRREGELNFKTVEAERSRFLDALTQELPKAEMDRLFKESLELKQGLITPATFYGKLKGYMKPEVRADYTTLYGYMEYLELFEGIDHASLFTEVENFTEAIKRAHFTTREQADLFQVAKDVRILSDLLELKLTPDTYDYYKNNKREFRPDAWADVLRKLGEPSGKRFALSPGPLSAAMPAMSGFYEVARQRDEAMVENALTQIKEFDVPFAVLIAGGFHTPAFERLFQKKHVSYAVVAPKVGKVTAADTEKYHRVLKETYVPMSEKYRKKLGITPPPAFSARQGEKTTRAASAAEFRPVSLSETRLAQADPSKES
ncbi:MAG: hypothetical protein COV76_07750 [Candidatus Omnitrophica bacterium CG11_big_fil_rev_8_21_14_0_20_64_10]|nr:MAG: hypothetical protein COV76_07750 [Candidatus Omnitrophica bacterium CG11_big_fil_rev_8_21_14_0_20_64_10]